jgi:hypothetical protein
MLAQDLLVAKRDLRLSKEIKKLARHDRLIINEMGYVGCLLWICSGLHCSQSGSGGLCAKPSLSVGCKRLSWKIYGAHSYSKCKQSYRHVQFAFTLESTCSWR